MKEFNPDDYENTGRRNSGRGSKRISGRRNFDRKDSERSDKRPSNNRRDFRPRFSEERSMHKVTCDSCGESCEVPFKPTKGKPIYCDACSKKNKNQEKMTRHLLSIADLSKKEILEIIKKAQDIKKHPRKYHKALYEKTLMTFFQAPSLRTEVSFDVAMFQMGGEIVDYHSETSPWVKGKESIEDVAKVISRYCDIIMIRILNHDSLMELANTNPQVMQLLSNPNVMTALMNNPQTAGLAAGLGGGTGGGFNPK